jgi:hypothetical protein
VARKQGKAALVWRRAKDEWRAGPFTIVTPMNRADCFYLWIEFDPTNLWRGFSTLDAAKSACQRLANEIMRAMKPAKKGRKRDG